VFFLSFLDLTLLTYLILGRMTFTSDFRDKKGKIHANFPYTETLGKIARFAPLERTFCPRDNCR